MDVEAVLGELKRLAAECERARAVASDMDLSDPRLGPAELALERASERFETAAVLALKAGVRDPRVLAVIAREYSDGCDGMAVDAEGLRQGLAWRLMVQDLAA
jgi:hypothetical protein